MMKSITVFTPTFNRAFCLDQLYQSLVSQTNQDFIWMIIDDGSSDNTKELVQSWIAESKITIEYFYKQNQGMHTGHNTAYKNITTELNVCIDSDDYMPNDAIDKIITIWKENGNITVAGIIGLDAFKDGIIVGTKIPETVHYSTLNDLYSKNKVLGDKKIVLRTDVVKEFPLYPVYENERLVPLGTLYIMIDSKYKFICSNEVFCIVEYLEDGSSRNILKQYLKSPNGFGYSRIVAMKYSKSLKVKFKSAIHLVSSALFAKNIKLLFQSPNLLLTFIAIPFGLVVSVYIFYKTRKSL
ncbi:glycosyltransferase family 2 protein [Flavobacterium sp. SUN052]|uniref:glycosyltransferase family 2 protein n=1 Tax=Flavobacterium sp. SUN052 TaxID=3002441 RepID=UPI00237D5E2D|nr:glycosyltransferase family 2 protein [Flavobacterium sp. SUN052]MEC4004417.1 glycosyltransferase family 2 protein [Flavobacterium sp. SUN052]